MAEVLSIIEAPSDAPVVFGRRHYGRLRFYWHGRANGGASLTDNIDLDLAAAGLIQRRDSHHGVSFTITPAGERELAREKAREIERRKPHHDLSGRLAAWLREQGRITWENIQIIVEINGGDRKAVRPDVFSMAKVYDEKRINPCVHEVKVSRSDFLADLAKPEKRAGYAAVAEVFYYVAPAGIIEPEEVPQDCGLVVEISTGVFEVLRKPRRRRVSLTVHHFMNLILKPGCAEPIV